jgi:O-antigen/teichoic acid export membrane protein
MKTTGSALFKFIKSSGIFLLGTVLSKAIVFFMLPIYTSYISPPEYGYYDLSITYITLIAGFLFLDIWTSVMRFLYDRKAEQEQKEVICSGWIIFGFSTLVYCVFGLIANLVLHIRYIGLIFSYGLFMNLTNLYGFITRGFEKNREFAISGIISTLITVALNIFLIVVLHCNFSALYIATIVGQCVQVIYLEAHIHIFKCIHKVYYNKVLTTSMFRYSLPLCFNTVSYWLLNSFNRIIINQVLGTGANGIFAVGAKFGAIISLVTACFTYAWQDISFAHTAQSGNDGAFYSRACNAYMKFLGAAAAVLIPGCYVIFPIMVNNSYTASRDTIPLFLLVGLISALSTFIGNVFYAIKDTRSIFISMVISCLLNLSLCYPFIKTFGLNGANISIFISFLVNIIIRNFILKRKVSFNLNSKIVIFLTLWIGTSLLIYSFCDILVNMIWFILCLVISFTLFRSTIKVVWNRLKKEGIFSHANH